MIGDSDFAANAYLGIEGNRDLFMNTVNWLAQQENLIAIRPREAADRRITLTANTSTGMFWITIVVIPAIVLGAGRLHLVAEALACAGSGPHSSWSSSLAGLVGYIYFVDSKQEPGGTAVKEKPFTTLQADDIEEVAGQERRRARRRGCRRLTASGRSSSRFRLLLTRAR